MIHKVEATIGGRTLTIETGRVAEQAGGAVLLRYGDTVVLGTATASESPREGIDFFPLTVDVEERMYAAGKIPGGFIKREGRPTEHSILSSRLTDRPIRPLFPKGYRNDVQVVITVLSADQENDSDVLGIIAASAALTLSDIPFAGPVGAARVGYIDGQIVINPTETDLKRSQLDLVVAGTADAVVMVEAGAKELPEETMIAAVRAGHEAMQALIQAQKQLQSLGGKPKREFAAPEPDAAIGEAVAKFVRPRFERAVNNSRQGWPRRRHQRGAQRAGRGAWRRSIPTAARRSSRSSTRSSSATCARRSWRRACVPMGAARRISARSGARRGCCRARMARRSSRAARRRCSAS